MNLFVGWIAEDGTFYPCPYGDHNLILWKIPDGINEDGDKNKELVKTIEWMGRPGIMLAIFDGKDKITRAQRETLFDLCTKYEQVFEESTTTMRRNKQIPGG